ncbi:MAG TPA: helix-turn-helix transcriptional regulator [Candidatus Rubrimentiphilum sp.]|nr:helix-turn-helix transcriptional regulator [Candidatus Rubrimentiphilum sp.]
MSRSIYSPRYAVLRALLVREREKRGFTQGEVARQMGRPQSFISKVESGERRLDVIELFEILDILGVDRARFMRLI